MDANANQEEQLRPQGSDPLPPELAWEQMEAGILEKMDAARNAADASGPTNNRGPILIGLLLLLLLIPMYCTLTGEAPVAGESVVASSPEPSRNTRADDAQPGADSPTEPSATPARASATPPTVAPASAAREGQSPPIKQQQTAPGLREPSDSFVATSSAPTSRKSPIDGSGIKAKEQPQRTAEITPARIPPTRNASGTAAAPFQSLAAQKDSVAQRAVTVLPRKPLFVSGADKTSALPLLRGLPIVTAHHTAHSEPMPRRLALLLGVADWQPGYGPERPARATYESELLAWQGGFTYLHPLPKRYTILVGLEWQQLESRFDYRAPVDDYQVTLRDTVLRVETNALTGKESKLRGDVTLTVPADRIVRHHNHTQILQIPLALGKTWQYRNWQADLFVGGAFTVYTKHRGRTLYRDEIRDYAGSTTDFIDNRWKFSTRLAGRLSYHIDRHLGITTGIQWQQSLGNWSTESNIIQRPSLVGLQFGITYSLP